MLSFRCHRGPSHLGFESGAAFESAYSDLVGMRCQIVATVLLEALLRVESHGYIAYPPLRGGTEGSALDEYCPTCGNGPGVCGDGGQWGEDSDFLGYMDGPQTTFAPGDVVEIVVEISAHHQGHFELGVCREQLSHSTEEPQACLDQLKLKRVPPPSDCVPNDARGDCQPMLETQQERWYLSPGTGTKKMHFQIPEDLHCEACTLQWRWWTGNDCPGPGYGCYFQRMRELGWAAEDWCHEQCGECDEAAQHAEPRCKPEEFKNCADIVVKGTASPTPAPTPLAPTPAPTEAPTPAPLPGSCVKNPDCETNLWCEDDLDEWCRENSVACPWPQCMRSS